MTDAFQTPESASQYWCSLGELENSEEFVRHLEAEFPFIRSTRYILALNQQRVESDRPVKDGDEIALMPPFAGG